MSKTFNPLGFGLIIIGSEILDGRVHDCHFKNIQALLRERNQELWYCFVILDEPNLITEKLVWAFNRPEPFFCCGGIGSTPDDYTRQCAAKAAGVGLEYHPEGLKIMQAKFGDRATEARLKLVEFPKGSILIPNPVNQVPGFSIKNGHFVPGFPNMAQPMIAWVLDTYYPKGKPRLTKTLLLPGAREGDLTPLMEKFTADFPSLRFSSLPCFTATGTEVRLGITGNPEEIQRGFAELTRRLNERGDLWIEE